MRGESRKRENCKIFKKCAKFPYIQYCARYIFGIYRTKVCMKCTLFCYQRFRIQPLFHFVFLKPKWFSAFADLLHATNKSVVFALSLLGLSSYQNGNAYFATGHFQQVWHFSFYLPEISAKVRLRMIKSLLQQIRCI